MVIPTQSCDFFAVGLWVRHQTPLSLGCLTLQTRDSMTHSVGGMRVSRDENTQQMPLS